MAFAAVIARSMAAESLLLPFPVAPKSRTFTTAAGPTSAEALGSMPPTTARAAPATTNPRRVLFIENPPEMPCVASGAIARFATHGCWSADGQVVQVGSTVRGGRRGADRVVA